MALLNGLRYWRTLLSTDRCTALERLNTLPGTNGTRHRFDPEELEDFTWHRKAHCMLAAKQKKLHLTRNLTGGAKTRAIGERGHRGPHVRQHLLRQSGYATAIIFWPNQNYR